MWRETTTRETFPLDPYLGTVAQTILNWRNIALIQFQKFQLCSPIPPFRMITEGDFLLLNNLRPGALTTARTPPFSLKTQCRQWQQQRQWRRNPLHHTTYLAKIRNIPSPLKSFLVLSSLTTRPFVPSSRQYIKTLILSKFFLSPKP
jgi:hypothetical protein